MTWLAARLAITSLLVVWIAVRMTRLADRIAARTGLSSSFVGLLLLAVATSLPELVTSLSATLLQGAPGLAFGNVFGSNVTNLAFIGLLDLMVAGSIYARATNIHVVTSIWVAVLTIQAVTAIVAERWLGGVSPGVGKLLTIGILVTYVIAVRESRTEPGEPVPGESGGVLGEAFMFCLCACAILTLGLMLTRLADELARTSGLGHTFVGTLVLALVTSLPELVVSVESVRLGNVDMAFGNLIGSNLFNVTILAICDLASPRANLYATAEALSSLPAAGAGLVMICLVSGGLWVRQRYTIGRLSPISIALILCYLIANVLTYLS